jgi:hypothetical protein
MKITTLTSALFASMLSIGAVQASTILVDDFNTPSTIRLVSDTTADGSEVSSISATSSPISLATTRTISVNLTESNTDLAEIKATVGGTGGYLNYSVSTGDNGIGKVIWALPTFTLPSGDSALSFSIIASALGSTANAAAANNIAFTFTGFGSNLGNNFSLNTSVNAYTFSNPGSPFNLALTGAQALTLSGGGQLALAFTGGQGWNLALDNFSINSDSPANVPVPASAALFGIALIAMRLVGKKSVANKK